MRLVGRLVVVAFGVLLAVAAASLFLFLSSVFDPVMARLTPSSCRPGSGPSLALHLDRAPPKLITPEPACVPAPTDTGSGASQ